MITREASRRVFLCGTVTRAERTIPDAPSQESLRTLRPYGGAVLAPAPLGARLTGPAVGLTWLRPSERLAA